MKSIPPDPERSPARRAARARVLLAGAVAVLSAAFAWFAGSQYLRGAEARIAERYEAQHRTREVVVAARRLEAGAVLEAAMLARRAIPERYTPRSAIAPERVGEVLGTELAQPLDRGDVLLSSLLRDRAERPLAARLAPGRRALTIPVDDTNSHAGLLRPGDLVDLLLFTVDEAPERRSAQVRPLLEAVPVLATGRVLDGTELRGRSDGGAARDFSTITVEVSARDAERIAIAERAGDLRVTLRGRNDVLRPVQGPPELEEPATAMADATRRRREVGGWHVDGWIGRGEGRLVSHRWRLSPSPGGDWP